MLGFPPLDIITEGLSTEIGEIDIGKLGYPIRVALKERIIGSLLEIVCREVLLSSPSEKPVAYLQTLHLSLDAHQASLKAVLKDVGQVFGIITYEDHEYSVLIGLYPPTHPVYFVDLLQYIPYIGIGYVDILSFRGERPVGIKGHHYGIPEEIFQDIIECRDEIR